jgi:hypothetical protein
MLSMQRVAKLNDAIKIPIKQICYEGWRKQINGRTIELDHVDQGIVLTVDGVRHPVYWRVHEQTIKCLHLRNGGGCPRDRRYVYFVYGRDGKRYRSLYLLVRDVFRLGTRVDHGLRYPRDCMSRRQRDAYKIRFDRRRARRKRARERQRDRQLAAFRARMGMT